MSKPALLSYLTDPQFLLIASLFLLLGGGIKGVIGLGLPLVSVPLLTYLLPVPVAISVLAAPVMVANCYQAMRGGLLVPVLRRIWPLLVAMVIGVLLGAQLLDVLAARDAVVEALVRLVRAEGVPPDERHRAVAAAVDAAGGVGEQPGHRAEF